MALLLTVLDQYFHESHRVKEVFDSNSETVMASFDTQICHFLENQVDELIHAFIQ